MLSFIIKNDCYFNFKNTIFVSIHPPLTQDVLRKIRECGSSVTYYGGRVVQTTTTNPLETYGNVGNNGQNAIVNHTTMAAIQNPTMMTQTQTRARVREIETCCNAANECQHHQQQHPAPRKQLEQKKLFLTKNENKENFVSRNEQNNSKNTSKDLGYKEGGNKTDCNGGKLLKAILS